MYGCSVYQPTIDRQVTGSSRITKQKHILIGVSPSLIILEVFNNTMYLLAGSSQAVGHNYYDHQQVWEEPNN